MKKNVINTIFVDEYKRKNKITAYLCVIVIFLILCLSFAFIYIVKNKKEYVSYSENSNINYKVYLKENNFFDKDFAEEKKQYIASLIDYIDADFKYNIDVEKDNVDFKYLYKIDAVVDVKEKNGTNSLYDFKENILDEKQGSSHGSSNINIAENVKIDYNHYNDIIKNFIGEYKLDDVVSTLTINMHVKTASSCVDFESDENTESVVSLVIPLTTKTMGIDITNNLADNDYNIIICSNSEGSFIYLVVAILMLLIDLYLVFRLSKYISKTRSARDVYERELKKILSNYHSFIQKVNNNFDLTGYQLVAIDTFTDLLEIRDTLNQPILMVESKEKMGVHFIIPSNTKLLYTYSLKVVEIKEK